MTLRGIDNQTVLLPRDQIRKLQASHTSIMPEGLTEAMTDKQLLDLFAYLTSRTPSRELKP